MPDDIPPGGPYDFFGFGQQGPAPIFHLGPNANNDGAGAGGQIQPNANAARGPESAFGADGEVEFMA